MTAYATLQDLYDLGLPPSALESVDPGTQERVLEAASRVADSYLRDKYHLPLSAPYDVALIDSVVQITAWRLLQRRGFNPNSPADTAIRLGYEDAIKFLTRVANGQAQLSVLQTSPDAEEPRAVSDEPRNIGSGKHVRGGGLGL